MFRRKFISDLYLYFSSLFLTPINLFGKLSIKNSLFQSGNWLKIESDSYRINNEIKIKKQWDYDFFSLADFARVMHFGIFSNEQKFKTVLYLEKDRITFTADNSFVVLNNQVLQFPVECFWEDESVWVPVKYFSYFLNKYTALQFRFAKEENKLIVEKTNVNVTGLRIDEKVNGTLIHVSCTRQFSEKEIVLDIRSGWFHIDIYGAKIDTASISAFPGSGIVSKVQGIQLGETASLAFKLKKNIISRDLVFSKDDYDFFVNLRTKDKIQDEHDKESEKAKKELDEQKKKWLVDTVVLDAGHGGKDPGAIGYKNIYEKNIVLPITLKLGKIIEEKMPGVKVVYTRKKDVFIPLWKRTQIANEAQGKLFISIHCNWNKNSRASGFETYFISADKDKKASEVALKENSVIQFEESHDRKKYEGVNFILATMAQSAFIKQSQHLASVIQSTLKSKLGKVGMKSRGIKQDAFWVMVGATMPNVLIETGFISNKFEANLLKKATTQNKMAEAIYQSLKKYKEDIESAI